jgi:hypothetical protein
MVSIEADTRFAMIAPEWSEPFRFSVVGSPAAEVARNPVITGTTISGSMKGA